MKKIALFLTGAFLSVSSIGAIASTSNNMVVESKFFDGNKTKVEKEQLPQEVIQSLEEGQYKDWEIQEAYKVQDEQTNQVHYELHLASSTDASMVRNVTFSEAGEIIGDKESELGRSGEQDLGQQGTEPGMESPQEGVDPEATPETEEQGTEEPSQQQQY